MRERERVLTSIEETDGVVLVRVYADHGDEFELIDWDSSPIASRGPLSPRGGLLVPSADRIDLDGGFSEEPASGLLRKSVDGRRAHLHVAHDEPRLVPVRKLRDD